MFTPQIFYCNVEECKHVVALKEQIKQLELENKRLKEDEKSLLNVIDDLQKTKNEWQEKYGDLGQDFDQLKAELKSAKELREYTYDCCKQAGEELAKNSFEWDGKEKNLVVQAMELNERYDQLKVENGGLKNAVMLKCPQCGEVYLNPMGCELYEENEELKEQFKLAEPLYRACNIKDAKINKLKQILAEIKEIVEQGVKIHDDIIVSKQILQKISECEGNDEITK